MITRVLIRDCGLITACFNGLIELYDTIEFQQKMKWDNETEVAVIKNLPDRKFQDTDFSEFIPNYRANPNSERQSIVSRNKN